MNDEQLYRAIYPEGTHLASSKDMPEAHIGAYLDDDTNQLAGQARFIPFYIDEDDVNDDGDDGDDFLSIDCGGDDDDGGDGDSDFVSASDSETDGIDPSLIIAIALAIVGTGVAVALAAPKIKKWWLGTAYPQVAKRFRPNHDNTIVDDIVQDTQLTIEAKKLSDETDEIIANPSIIMDDAEAQERFIAMLLAAGFAVEHFRILQNAQILDADTQMIDKLASASVADLANSILKQNPRLLDDASQESMMKYFGGGTFANGIYLPIQTERFLSALEYPEPEA